MRVIEDFLRDLVHAVRVFRQSPAFALAAGAALTLGPAILWCSLSCR